jgi:hypothetical protein
MARNNFLKDNSSLIIGLVVLYFGYTKVIKPLLEGVGLSKSDEEIEIEKQTSNPGSPWNPNYWRKGGAMLIRETDVQRFVNTIWNAPGYISDDFDAVLGVFKQLKTKSQVSYLADKFNQMKGKDLLNWLQGGGALSWPADRFSAEQVNQLIKYVNGLKNY